MTWLDGVERIPNARAGGGTYVAGVPWKFCAHTTEVVPSAVDGARAMARRHEYPPHLWAWPEKDWVGQTVPLDRAAFALKHPAGTPETNKLRVIQVELIGRAADTPGWPLEWWEWIGRRVLRPVIAAGYSINLGNVAPTTGNDGYGVHGRVRLSRAAFRVFDGVLCHANVPDNEHWDLGDGRLDLIARGAAGTPMPEPLPVEEDDMPKVYDIIDPHPDKGASWLLVGNVRYRIPNPDYRNAAVAAWGEQYVSAAAWDLLRSATSLDITPLIDSTGSDPAEVARLVLDGLGDVELSSAQVAALIDVVPKAVADELDRRTRARLG